MKYTHESISPRSVAIVGIGAIFPGAPAIEDFWRIIAAGRSMSRRVPEGRWPVPPESVYSPHQGTPDSVYSLHGCFIDELPPLDGLSGLSVDLQLLSRLDPLYQLLLHAGSRAFGDGITEGIDRSRIGVIVGNLALPSEGSAKVTRDLLGSLLEEKLFGTVSTRDITDPLNCRVAGLPAGLLGQALGLGGTCYTLDAACASSLYAIKLAMDELLSGRADAMLTGGVSRPDPLFTQMGFSQLRALSRKGVCSPFDMSGDGLVVGEGAGIFLLKRTEDAVRQGDRIYGIIRGIGLSNDVGGSLLAPMGEGQLRAMRAAYRQAGWKPQDVDLIECHATGTPVGDATEIASLIELWKEGSDNIHPCVIGSVKSNIGHLLTGAGAAALTKVLLAMKHQVLPPTANFRSPIPGSGLPESPFRVLSEPLRWESRSGGEPRRAAVSAFGFGGINAHLLVEEWLQEDVRGSAPVAAPSPSPQAVAIVGMGAEVGGWQNLREVQERLLGGRSEDLPSPPKNWWGAESSGWFREAVGCPPAGFYLEEVASGTGFRIPPKEMEEMLPQQLLMLKTAAGAMADAGAGRDDNVRTGVFMGVELDLNSTNFSLRWVLRERIEQWNREKGLGLSPGQLDEWAAGLRSAAGPPLTANRTMGALGSIVASRIAREFRAGGPSFTVANGENSGLRALEVACSLLERREIDRALVGAVDLAGDPRAVAAAGAARKPADAGLAGEGATAMVLKRLEDAERDGDRIYAVIRGFGSAGGPLIQPGQHTMATALARAHEDAGVDGGSIGSLELSGLPAASAEAAAHSAFFGAETRPADRTVALTTLSGQTGSCGAATGLLAVLKSSLSLYQEILPPSGIVEGSGSHFQVPPFRIQLTPSYWLRNRCDGARRAGVSSVSLEGNCTHVILESWEKNDQKYEGERAFPLGRSSEQLFLLRGSRAEIRSGAENMRSRLSAPGSLTAIAQEWWDAHGSVKQGPHCLAVAARNREELDSLLAHVPAFLDEGQDPVLPPHARDRIFFSSHPLGEQGTTAFVFPGSGSHFRDMGREFSLLMPQVLRRQDRENLHLRSQLQPDLFWNGDGGETDMRGTIFGQVSFGCITSDIFELFGIRPDAVIGYSLGESAGFFATRTWQDRDLMLHRMSNSTLFTHDLAGENRAAAATWGIAPGEKVAWLTGVVDAPAAKVREVLLQHPRVYLLIVNTPDECVIGGEAADVRKVAASLGCRLFPLEGVTTVHCPVARQVAQAYRDLHLFPVFPPAKTTFYSGAWGRPYQVTTEAAADAIIGQAVDTIDFPALVEKAYEDGVRLFVELGPGSSCSRMISRILAGRPHLARSVSVPSQGETSSLLRTLGNLAAEGLFPDLGPLFAGPRPDAIPAATAGRVRLVPGGSPFTPPPTPRPTEPVTGSAAAVEEAAEAPVPAGPFREVSDFFMATQEALVSAHGAFLGFAETIAASMAEALSLRQGIEAQLLRSGRDPGLEPLSPRPVLPDTILPDLRKKPCRFDRDLCLEFATGSVARMLGPEFQEVDRFPTRVRLPDEPLMLVDRILTLEGAPRSMTSGRVVTEHDVLDGAWYLDGGRIPTCIAVEAGQADLFLSGYLGIDFITRGLAVYRLLDAVVTFHAGLPGPGKTIRYDIRIDHFFRQGDTWLFRFRFDATVDGMPLLTMRDGCAGFFSQSELDAGKGIVRPRVSPHRSLAVPASAMEEFVPMGKEKYTCEQLDRLREGDLEGCFGPLFSGIPIVRPVTIPGGRMRLVHRVTDLDPDGGPSGLGSIRAEADIDPRDWFLTCHFVDDRVMPGTLMYECCMHTLRILLLRMGWVAEETEASWQPVPGVDSRLKCRGQVLESTSVVTYEVTLREAGFRPEPYVIVDALMYADGKPIVEIGSMSARLTGTDRDKLKALWAARGASRHLPNGGTPATGRDPLYTKEQILAYSNGNPSEGFGDRYAVFDRERVIARLPGPPYQFLDRIVKLEGDPWVMKAGALAVAEYDVPADEWYFREERHPYMPFAVLLEAALQPCGWLAAYMGSALTSPSDLAFRNLGGTAVLHRAVTPDSGVLTAAARLKKVATSGGMIIQEFDLNVSDQRGIVYEGETMFGFFSREALAQQVGIRDAKPYLPEAAEMERSRSLPFPAVSPFPDTMLRMIDHIDLFIPDGGPASLGYLQGSKRVDPGEWFFQAHFYQDPVTPGSLGLESFLQLMKFAAVERWGWEEGRKLSAVAPRRKHSWLYRGQIIPFNREVTVQAWITAVDDAERVMTGSGFLSVDGKLIYQMNDFTVKMEVQETA